MQCWRIGVFALAVHLALAPQALAQEAPPAGPGNDGESEQATSGGTAAPAPTSPPQVPLDQPFKRVLPNFWHDITHFPTVDTAIVVGIGGALSAIAAKNDQYLTQHASAGGEDTAYTAGGAFGSGFTQFGIAAGAYAIGRLTHQERTAHIGADLIRAQILSAVITRSVKLIAQRERPTTETEGNTDSFPSGHASAAWTTTTVLWRHFGWKVGVPASLVASFASASRLQQNDHYMSDVLFGAAIGVAVGRTVTFGHGERQIIVAPTPVAGGAAITFTLLDRK
jgi:hypothetical protein